jgi:hypothetical protein
MELLMSKQKRLNDLKKMFYTVYLNNIGGNARSVLEENAFRAGVSLVLDFYQDETVILELNQLEGFESKNFPIRPNCAKDNQRLVCEFLKLRNDSLCGHQISS